MSAPQKVLFPIVVTLLFLFGNAAYSQGASKVSETFIVAQFQESYSSEAEVFSTMREIVTHRDKQRPLEKRFEVKALEESTPIALKNGAKLIKAADLGFVIAPNKQGGYSLFGSGKGMYFSSLSSAKEWVSDFAEIAPGKWQVFEQQQGAE